jgi:uncharacterized membrane protein YqjE
MHVYDIALFVHMLGLISLFGAFVISVRAGARLRAATTLEQARTWLGLLVSTTRMFPAGLGLLLVSGLYMMIDRWKSPYPWIVVALVGLILLGALGGGVVDRRLRAMSAAAAEGGEAAAERLFRLIADPLPWTLMAALNGLALGVVWVMSTKPRWAGSIGVVALAAVLGAVLGSLSLRRGRRTAALPGEHSDERHARVAHGNPTAR